MAVSGKAIKTRIKSVKNTKKMTKAMEMVSAAKMRKSVSSALSTRTYALLARELMENLTSLEKKKVPLLETRPVKKMLLIVMASNKGLCGSFNANVIKKATQVVKNKEQVSVHKGKSQKDILPQENVSIDVIGIGKKTALFAKKNALPLTAMYDQFNEKPAFDDITPITKTVLESFQDKVYDKVLVIYTYFRSPLVQEVRLRQLLPISSHSVDEMLGSTMSSEQKKKDEIQYVFEPDAETILRDILPRLVEIQLYESVLESAASEHSARMLAMKNASTAAGDMIQALTLEYNKARQAAITREISEIVGGAAALE